MRLRSHLLAVCVLAFSAAVCDAAPIPATPVYTKTSRFKIPFRYDPAEMQALGAKEIRLYVSRDRGLNYQQIQAVAPDAAKFTFQAPSDGEYWFCVKTLDSKGKLHPDGPSMEPGLQVIVDSITPQLRLELRQTSLGRVQLAWTASDEHLDPTQLRLEYVQPGSPDWQLVSIVPKPNGQTEWSVPQAGIVAVRGTITDLARNLTQHETQLRVAAGDQSVPKPNAPDFRQPIASPGLHSPNNLAATFPDQFAPQFNPGPATVPLAINNGAPPAIDQPQFEPIRTRELPASTAVISAAPKTNIVAHQPVSTVTTREVLPQPMSNPAKPADRDPLTARYRVVSSRQFQIGYKLQDVGPSGISGVELFITQDDGANWYKYGDDPDQQSPAQVEVPKPGTYGFSLGVRSGAGLASEPPQPGEKPSIVVVVDQSPPRVELLPLQQGRGRALNKILIEWRYSDDFPAERPISISYSPNGQAPWQPITGWQENSGSYVWTMGPGAPSKFYVRLEARDAAGNVQIVETPQPVLIDLSRPTAKIIDIEAASN